MTIREDVMVYNESTGLVFTCTGLGGCEPCDAGSDEWLEAVAEGRILAVELAQDDPVVVRIVVDGELTGVEEAEAIDFLASKLVLPADGLSISGGVEYVQDPGDEGAEEYVRHVAVPAGEYRVGLYTYFTSPNCPLEHEGWPQPVDAGERAYVGFLLRLTTLPPRSPEPVAATEAAGWVAHRPPTRCPATPPRGIPALEPRE